MSKKESYSAYDVIVPIKDSIEKGYGIVPLIGSGMSAASGIPAGTDYHSYLFYCLARVFGTDGNSKEYKEQWDPSSLRWPDYEDIPVYNDLKIKMIDWTKSMVDSVEVKVLNKEKEAIPIWQAAGSVADWRAMLDLLSRLSLGMKAKNGFRPVIIKYPDHRIIDSFFVNLTKGKKPNSAHFLLAHLSDILKIKIILTTNFDNLIENTFQALVNPVAVFDVHMDSSLPDAELVRAQRSVVKMHGGRYGLRADFSLDKYPNTLDVEKFVDYLSFNKNHHGKSLDHHQRNLLIMGIAPDSFRTMALICRAIQRLPQLKIFWVCYNVNKVGEVIEAFEQTFKNLKNGKESIPVFNDFVTENLKICVVPDLSFFLLELYQTLFLSVPPAGVQFNTIWPFPPERAAVVKNENGFKVEISNFVAEINMHNEPTSIWAYSEKEGLTSLASEVFNRLRVEYNCIWMNLENSYTCDDFKYFIIESIMKKTGNVSLFPTSSSLVQEQFENILSSSRRKFLFFINCREVEDVTKLKSIIEYANLLNHQSINIIFLGWKDPEIIGLRLLPYDIEVSEFQFDKLNNLIKEQKNHQEFYRFVLSLSSLRHTAYISLLISWSFIKAPHPLSTKEDNDQKRFDKAHIYLNILRDCNAIRDDNGYFVYMPQRIRIEMNNKLQILLRNKYYKIKAESHQGIADWYMKLFRASGDVQAALESIYHRIQCFSISYSKESMEEKFAYSSLNEAILTIILLKQTIKTSFHSITLIHTFNEIINLIDKYIEKKIVYYDKTLIEINKDLVNIIEKYRESILQEKSIDKNNLNHLKSFKVKITGSKESFNNNQANDLLEQVKQSINYRNYEKAFEIIYKIFSQKEIDFHYKSVLKISKTESLRKSVRKWILDKIHTNKDNALNQDISKYVVKVCRQFQLLKLYCAYFEKEKSKDRLLIEAEKIYIISTELMRYIDDNEFLNRENAVLRSNTAIVLSNMNRHHEAYRKYNEAYGYLNFGIRPDEPLKFAIIDLRRGETFLVRIAQKFSSRNKSTTEVNMINHFGVLYDAIAGIDRGESRMKGNTIHSRWYAWMYELQMQLCIEIVKFRKIIEDYLNKGESIVNKYDFSSHCRDCEKCGKRFIKNLERGIEIAGDDVLRYKRYYLHADIFKSDLKKCKIIEKTVAGDDIDKRIKKAQEKCESRIEKLVNTDDGIYLKVKNYKYKLK